MLKPTGARILFLDIETAPILASVWSIWQVNVGLNQIEKDWHLLSFAAKWLDDKRVFYYDQSKERHVENDKRLCARLHKLLDEANIIVAQNGRKFDIPKINARLIVQGFQPPSPYKIVDTKEIAKKNFGFTSNRLEHLSRLLCKHKKSEHKKFPGFELWRECLKGNQAAWDEMRKYNILDLLTLEELYLKMRGWASNHSNVGVFVNDLEPVCPRCGSKKVAKNGFQMTSVAKYQRYICSKCGAYSRGAQMLNCKEKRFGLLRTIY
jgi:uncharacterized protein YprB with RNaseH-like and TPR domain